MGGGRKESVRGFKFHFFSDMFLGLSCYCKLPATVFCQVVLRPPVGRFQFLSYSNCRTARGKRFSAKMCITFKSSFFQGVSCEYSIFEHFLIFEVVCRELLDPIFQEHLFPNVSNALQDAAEQRDIFRPELFYNYISLWLKNKPMHYKNANKFEEKKTLIHRTPF